MLSRSLYEETNPADEEIPPAPCMYLLKSPGKNKSTCPEVIDSHANQPGEESHTYLLGQSEKQVLRRSKGPYFFHPKKPESRTYPANGGLPFVSQTNGTRVEGTSSFSFHVCLVRLLGAITAYMVRSFNQNETFLQSPSVCQVLLCFCGRVPGR